MKILWYSTYKKFYRRTHPSWSNLIVLDFNIFILVHGQFLPCANIVSNQLSVLVPRASRTGTVCTGWQMILLQHLHYVGWARIIIIYTRLKMHCALMKFYKLQYIYIQQQQVHNNMFIDQKEYCVVLPCLEMWSWWTPYRFYDKVKSPFSNRVLVSSGLRMILSTLTFNSSFLYIQIAMKIQFEKEIDKEWLCLQNK